MTSLKTSNNLINWLFYLFCIGVAGYGLLTIGAVVPPGLDARALADDVSGPFEALDRRRAEEARRAARRRNRQRSANRRRRRPGESYSASNSSRNITRNITGAGASLPPMNGVLAGDRQRYDRPQYRRPGNNQRYDQRYRGNGYASERRWPSSGPGGGGVQSSELAPLPGTAGPGTAGNGGTAGRGGAGRYDGAGRYNETGPGYGQTERGYGTRYGGGNGSGGYRPGGGGGDVGGVGRGFRSSAALPADIWRGLDIKQTEALLSGLSIPPQSPALHSLWRQLWLSADMPADETSGQDGDRTRRNGNDFQALRLEALYRSGLVRDVAAAIDARDAGADPLLATLRARALIGLGQGGKGCRIARRGLTSAPSMPKPLQGQMQLVMGYCAVVDGNKAGAGLAADLLRDSGVKSPLALAVMDALSHGGKPRLEVPAHMTLMDYRFLQLVSSASPLDSLDTAEPALIGALAEDRATKPRLRLAAGERAARINAIGAATLADIYHAQRFNAADIKDPLPTRSKPPLRRALLTQAIEAERDPVRQARLMQALLKLAAKGRLTFPISKLLSRPLARLPAGPRLAWFDETAVKIAVWAGDYTLARRWAGTHEGALGGDTYNRRFADRRNRGGSGGLDHWLALIDIADPQVYGGRSTDLPALEEPAHRGRFNSAELHRLATVLDALQYNVPIPLWEAASRTPQPAGGHLPKTGILTRLSAAAKQHQIARTILLSLHSIGGKGPAKAHMIALGDSIRALKRAGLEADARRLGFEALIDGWPQRARR